MNRTDRLLAIMLELQAAGRRRAEDLASTFETSKRTIYRDIQALCEAGVPVVAIPGQGYSLMEGYFLPPLSFTAEEARLLLAGSELVAGSLDGTSGAAARSAGRKIEAVLAPDKRAEVATLQATLRFVRVQRRAAEPSSLALLQQAVADCRRVRFRYHGRSAEEGEQTATVREADPYGLANAAGAWYLSAYCHLRRAVRHFRLDRIEALELLDMPFTRPADLPPIEQHAPDDRALVVRALFDGRLARRVREARTYYVEEEEETEQGLLVTLRARRESDVLGWLLGWGSAVRVLEPPSLRRRMAREIVAMLREYIPAPFTSDMDDADPLAPEQGSM